MNFRDFPVIPGIKINDAGKAAELARALLAGGIGIAEITLRTDAGLQAIGAIRDNVPDMCVGAGSVMNAEIARAAVNAGAQFIVSPGFDAGILEFCREKQLPYVPGCATATEVA